jgi:cellulose synthase/poly-beta-1,6-N-acetylglucosamine synthase-like glycosyltransferase
MRLIPYIHALITASLAIYGLHYLIMSILYLCHRREAETTPPVDPSDLPHVTVQISVYNERHVVERVIDHVAAFDYPRDKLHIHVLDDSTDETLQLSRAQAALHRERGVDITVLRRLDRGGFKAGAQKWGLTHVHSEYVAYFDADFCPHPDFLLKTIPHFLARPRLGMIQARWSHLNADYSILTRAQAMIPDGLAIERTAQCRSGLFTTFAGSGGVWRRRCIEDAGGWQVDTLCEDIDLSYRAQMAGWEFLHLLTVDVPAELPPQIAAFKQQQSRWSQGWIQSLRKLTGPILRSRKMKLNQKAMALLHLSGYLVYAAMLMNLLLSLPLLLAPPSVQPFALVSVLGLLGSVGPLLFFTIAQQRLYPDWIRRLGAFPVFSLLTIGTGWYPIRGIWRGLTRWGGPFIRTPKFRIEGKSDQWADSSYRLHINSGIVVEIVLAIYALCTIIAALTTGHYEMIPLLLLYATAFAAAAGTELIQGYTTSSASSTSPASCLDTGNDPAQTTGRRAAKAPPFK